MKKLFRKIKDWYDKQTDTTKGMLWFALILVILIALRWKAVVAGVTRGFNFYTHGTLPE